MLCSIFVVTYCHALQVLLPIEILVALRWSSPKEFAVNFPYPHLHPVLLTLLNSAPNATSILPSQINLTMSISTAKALALRWFIYYVSVSAASNATETVGFIRGDNERDTISLIMSCILTLGLCVYSAIHLNVPPKEESYIEALWRQTKWCLTALLAPELVLYVAWNQRASAKKLCEDLEKLKVTELKDILTTTAESTIVSKLLTVLHARFPIYLRCPDQDITLAF